VLKFFDLEEEFESEEEMCQTVYIYVHDDDDTEQPEQPAGLNQKRVLVSDKIIERLANNSSSVVVSMFFLLFSLFLLF